MRQVERWFGRAAYPLVFVAPNNLICLMAGAAGMSVGGFFAVNLAGTVPTERLLERADVVAGDALVRVRRAARAIRCNTSMCAISPT